MTGVLVAGDRAATGDAWFFVHDLFRAPDARQWEWLQSERVIATCQRLAEALQVSDWRRQDWPADRALYESEFIAAFDAGAPAPLVPLLESHYNKREPVPRILHENILFYKAFGLNLRDRATESADHLRYQLEFVGYLYRLECATGQRDDGGAEGCVQIAQGRSDFITRHLLTWLPSACEKVRAVPFGWVRNDLALALALVAASA